MVLGYLFPFPVLSNTEFLGARGATASSEIKPMAIPLKFSAAKNKTKQKKRVNYLWIRTGRPHHPRTAVRRHARMVPRHAGGCRSRGAGWVGWQWPVPNRFLDKQGKNAGETKKSKTKAKNCAVSYMV